MPLGGARGQSHRILNWMFMNEHVGYGNFWEKKKLKQS